jgi:synapsin
LFRADRSKYFRGRRIHGDWDVRVEQAEFREISITANSESGVLVSMAVIRNGTKVVRYSAVFRVCFTYEFSSKNLKNFINETNSFRDRSFRPDFALVRQNVRDASEDYKSIILALMYGNVPTINNLEAVYHFQVSSFE